MDEELGGIDRCVVRRTAPVLVCKCAQLLETRLAFTGLEKLVSLLT
ncbi:MAG: hypothetical protein AAGU73_09155 [Actinomycetota bacterium]